MSRPQFSDSAVANSATNARGHTPGLIVNNGLIDFQDNFYRGMSNDYSQFMAAQQQQQCGLGAQLPYSAPTFQSPLQHVGLPQTTLLGHPSFINVAGKMYKPVEDPTTTAEPRRLAEAVVEPAPTITDEDVDRRVAQKLKEWTSSQRGKAAPSMRKRSSDEERAAARVKSVMGRQGKFYSPA
jgi:hypothetical protein